MSQTKVVLERYAQECMVLKKVLHSLFAHRAACAIKAQPSHIGCSSKACPMIVLEYDTSARVPEHILEWRGK